MNTCLLSIRDDVPTLVAHAFDPPAATVPVDSPLPAEPPTQRPISTNSRSRYVIQRRPNGSHAFELRAHNGETILSSDSDAPSDTEAEARIDRIRELVGRDDAIEIRQSLTGKWYYRVCDGDQVLAASRPFDYRSRMQKALYAARACAPSSRVVREP